MHWILLPFVLLIGLIGCIFDDGQDDEDEIEDHPCAN